MPSPDDAYLLPPLDHAPHAATPWDCTTDGVTEPCGECQACKNALATRDHAAAKGHPRPRSAGMTAATVLESPHPEIRSEPAERLGREGMVTVWDEHGRIVGCMGVELWRALLNAQAVAP